MSNKSPSDLAINDNMPMRNIVSRTFKNDDRKMLSTSQQARRRQSNIDSYNCGFKSRKESLYKDSMFVLYKIAPQIKIQIKEISHNPFPRTSEIEARRCSKFYVQRKADDLPSMLLSQMKSYHPSRELHTILRTPYSKGYEMFKEQIGKKNERDSRMSRRKYSEYN